MSSLIPFAVVLAFANPEPDIKIVREALRDRESRVRSIQAEYSVWHGRIGFGDPAKVKVPQKYRWVTQGVRKMLASETWTLPGSEHEQRRNWFSFDGRDAYHVWYAPQHTDFSYEITKRRALDEHYFEDAFLAVALGDCIVNAMTTESLQNLVAQPESRCFGREEMAGEPVVKIEVAQFPYRGPGVGGLTAWLATERDWLPKRIDVEDIGVGGRIGLSGLRYPIHIDKYMQVSDSANPSISHWFPAEFHYGKTRCIVDSVKINDPVGVEAFRPPMQLGARFVDQTTVKDLQYPGSERSIKTVPVEIIGGEAGREEHERISELLQNPLPDSGVIGIGAVPASGPPHSNGSHPPIDPSAATAPKLPANLPDRWNYLRITGWSSFGILLSIGACASWRRLKIRSSND